MNSWTPPTDEMVEKALASVIKETDRRYFFSKLKNPLWVEPLSKRGYFSNPPGSRNLPNGIRQFPHWPELTYLVAITDEVPDQVIEIVLSLPETDNSRVYSEVLEIALKLKNPQSAKLLPKIIEYIKLDYQLLASRYADLVKHWAEQGHIDEALEIAKLLVAFRKCPRAECKQRLSKKQPESIKTLPEPTPRVGQWEYQQILERGIRPLADRAPYRVARILIDAVASMIRLGMHHEYFEKGKDEDYSEIWCRRLDKQERDYQDERKTLVQTLTYACEQVYESAPEFIGALDETLKRPRWKVFKRLRQHLYASHPSDQTLQWIREQILDHNDYHEWKHHYEFQLMIRKASEHFGHHLLSEHQRKGIFDAILSGPSREHFREWMGGRYSKEAFRQHQQYFHRMQLRPFATLLSGRVQRYFDELEGEPSAEAITDDTYLPYSGSGETSDTVGYRSPKSAKDIESLTDDELLTYLNDWNEERWDEGNRLLEINITALADVFQSHFKEKIAAEGGRLDFWLKNRERIARPVYVAAMLKAMVELIKEKNFDNLDQWIAFCGWVLSHPDTAREEGQPEPRDESRDHPDWRSSRRAVVDFIDACVHKETEAPITARGGLGDLLQKACLRPDWRLDHPRPVLLNDDDQITKAINNTRSRALESLVNFGFWIRRKSPEDDLPVPEVTDILAERITRDAEIPLTRPEHALLGRHFGNLCTLNRDWAAEQREVLFPQENESLWLDAFGSYIRFNRPYKPAFGILRSEFEFGIKHLNILVTDKRFEFEITHLNMLAPKDLIDKLGQHVFLYYLWEMYPLTGDESLLERFYCRTMEDRKRWGRLFDCVGRYLRYNGPQFDQALTDRILAFFDWRFETAELLELQEFTFWLEAECLSSDWRLQSYLKILNLVTQEEKDRRLRLSPQLSLQVSFLHKLLPTHQTLVVECFAKITDAMDQDTQLHISANEAKPILNAGLTAEDPHVRKNAERARENLLKLGRFDFLDVE
ncbi:hypothetical protein [Candidatus Foliamicus sp.]